MDAGAALYLGVARVKLVELLNDADVYMYG